MGPPRLSTSPGVDPRTLWPPKAGFFLLKMPVFFFDPYFGSLRIPPPPRITPEPGWVIGYRPDPVPLPKTRFKKGLQRSPTRSPPRPPAPTTSIEHPGVRMVSMERKGRARPQNISPGESRGSGAIFLKIYFPILDFQKLSPSFCSDAALSSIFFCIGIVKQSRQDHSGKLDRILI